MSHDQHWKAHDVSWVNLMSTCEWLRRIGLDTRDLWYLEGINIPGNAEWRRICQSRAGGMPMILKSQIGQINEEDQDPDSDWEEKIEDALGLIGDYLPQATEAFISYLKDPQNDLSESVEQSLYSTLSRYLSCDNLRYFNLSWQDFTLSDVFLGGTCAQLTTLVLSHIGEVEMGPELPALRHLYIQLALWQPQIGILGLLEWLSSLSTLEVLDLDCNAAKLIFGDFDGGEAPAIDLPNLRILKLQVVVDDAAQLLRLFPDPSLGLDVTLTEKSTFPRFQTLEAEVALSYQYVISRIVSFCYEYQGDPQPVSDLQVIVNVLRYPATIRNSQIRSAAVLSYRSFSGERLPDITHRFCNFLGPQRGHTPPPPIRSVDLHLTFVSVSSTWFSTSNEIIPDKMTIRTVIWDMNRSSTDEECLQVRNWLTERKLNGNGIASLQIRNNLGVSNAESERIIGQVQRVVIHILNLQLVNRVEWI